MTLSTVWQLIRNQYYSLTLLSNNYTPHNHHTCWKSSSYFVCLSDSPFGSSDFSAHTIKLSNSFQCHKLVAF